MGTRGRMRKGVVVLESGSTIPEGTLVQVEPVPTDRSGPAADDPLFRMGELAVETGLEDLATNIDHYLYGHPKADDGA